MLMRSLGQLFETLRRGGKKILQKTIWRIQVEDIYVGSPFFIVSQMTLNGRQQDTVFNTAVCGQQPVTLLYLPTRPANGWTCRDVPIIMRRSQRGKSWLVHKQIKKFIEFILAKELFDIFNMLAQQSIHHLHRSEEPNRKILSKEDNI